MSHLPPTKSSLLLPSLLTTALAAHAASLTPGDLLIYRVGNGSAALGTVATPVFLDEFTPSGTFVQSFALPSTGLDALTAVGNATTEGIMSLSQDGKQVLFTGYRANAGASNPSSSSPATVNRVLGTFSLDTASHNTSLALTDTTGTIRSATSPDGSSLYYVGTSASVRYVGSPGPTATSVPIDARNSRQVLLVGPTLFASNGSTALTQKIQSYGDLPTGTTVPSGVAALTSSDAINGFAFFDLSPIVPGVDTLYALSTVETKLRKFTFDGTVWAQSGSVASSASNLAGAASGSEVSLYMTSGGTLSSLTDTTGYGGTLSGTVAALDTADANTGYRGLVIIPTPVPEPSHYALLAGLGLFGFAIWRRRATASA